LTLMYAIRGLVQSQFHHPDDYSRITAPTIVVAHGGDGLHPVRAAELLAEKIPNAELVVSSTPGYWQANPGEFLALMMDWLERLGASN
jgi:pimeloyl-ACP methyl ester carboxylesterase